MSEVILKDCPHCGAHSFDFLIEKVTYVGPSMSSPKGGQVVCTKCGMQGPWMPSHVGAIKAWNALPRNEEATIDNSTLPEPEFRWGDKVEVRDKELQPWHPAIYTGRNDFGVYAVCKDEQFVQHWTYCRHTE